MFSQAIVQSKMQLFKPQLCLGRVFEDAKMPAFNPLYKSQCILSIYVMKENFCVSSITGRVSRRSCVTKFIKIQTEGTATELKETLNRGTQRWFPPKYIENTFQAIQSTFRYLEMHSKRCYKTCICSVIRRKLESFRNYKVLSIIFPKILDEV